MPMPAFVATLGKLVQRQMAPLPMHSFNLRYAYLFDSSDTGTMLIFLLFSAGATPCLPGHLAVLSRNQKRMERA